MLTGLIELGGQCRVDPLGTVQRRGRQHPGIRLHSDLLADDEICHARGVPATTPARTAFDLGRRKGLTTAVVRIDALRQATRLTVHVNAEMLRYRPAVIVGRTEAALRDAGATLRRTLSV